MKDFLYSNVSISQNYCYSSSSLTVTNIPILEVTICENKLIDIRFDTVVVHDLGNIQDTLDLFPTIENFVVTFKKPLIRGKYIQGKSQKRIEANKVLKTREKPGEKEEAAVIDSEK